MPKNTSGRWGRRQGGLKGIGGNFLTKLSSEIRGRTLSELFVLRGEGQPGNAYGEEHVEKCKREILRCRLPQRNVGGKILFLHGG